MRLLPFFLLLLLAGCTLFESPAERALRRSPDFKAGYSDGCASANASGANPREESGRRDEDAFSGNKAYRTGWNEGFGACRSYQNQPANAGPVNVPGPGGGGTP